MLVFPRSIAVPKIARLAVIGATGALLSLFAAPARGFVYWAEGDAIGRANLDGSKRQDRFIRVSSGNPRISVLMTDVAVNARHVYWSATLRHGGSFDAWLGRARLGGSHVQRKLVVSDKVCDGIALQGSFMFWSTSFSHHETLERATLTGSHQTRLVGPPKLNRSPGHIASDATHVYWASSDVDLPDGGYAKVSINRAHLDGTGVEENFIPLPKAQSSDVAALDVDDEYIYWIGAHGIGRARLDGTEVTPRLIDTDFGFALAVDGEHIYWAEYGTPRIGRANLDGSGAQPKFITTRRGTNVTGLAVDAGGAAETRRKPGFSTELLQTATKM